MLRWWWCGRGRHFPSQSVLAVILRSLEMGSELELVTATCSDGYHLAWVETVMGQTPILHSREYCHFTLRKSGSTKEEFVTLPFSSKIQETHTLPSRAEG